MKYNKKLLDKFINEKVAVATRTQKEFNDFMELLKKETDLRWPWGENPTENKDLWCYEKHETAVICDFFDEGELGHSDEEFYKEHGYEIIEYQDLIKGEYMKTNEFIKRVEALGYEVVSGDYDSTVLYIRADDVLTATIKADELNSVNTRCSTDIPSELFDLLVEYARTPIDEREEEPKYYWKIKGLDGLIYASNIYLNYVDGEGPTLNTKGETINTRTKFTKKEFKEICERHNITLEFDYEEIGERK